MKLTFDILRRSSAESEPCRQKIPYETDDERETVATALTKINEAALCPGETGGCDITGKKITPVRWESGCLQKKCGACAMLINGRPRLACDSFLKDFAKKGTVMLEPLSKFPVVADLIVDRSIMMENLKTLRVWSDEAVPVREKKTADVYDAASCLQCGCCLEVCPNFFSGGDFLGAAGFVPNARLLLIASREERSRVKAAYKKHVYNGCGKSLACENICPAGIDINRLLSKSNALELWRVNGK